ncbi:hypothetical protein LTR62_000311 [Meristemomyces frigidus]|uniref:Uncharacterized protein n=1 Tax=Meristemomyces frigidus TaxID=1508187 RepID=A0AAN7TJE3_9PEZI|nr:hypothetical protein LTR62_000311 [Meristemomyces frigidus]
MTTARHHTVDPTFPRYYSTRTKARRWPLVLRFVKGAIHANIATAVLLHAIFAALVCYLDMRKAGHLAIPSSVVPSLSIVVGLLLVFRNSTSYDRFWRGCNHVNTIETSVRNLTRSFLACSCKSDGPPPSTAEQADTERTVRILLAMMYATKHHLRGEWGASRMPVVEHRRASLALAKSEYDDILPSGTEDFQDQGLGLLLQLTIPIEAYIKRGHDRAWFHAPQASQLSVQLNTLVAAYGSLETIHLTPLPVAYLIHLRQVLALFCCALPFALVAEMRWWSVLLTAFLAFTLYGVEGIGAQLEDPFGYGRSEIKLDAVCEDLRVEMGVLLREWRAGGNMFPEGGVVR